MSHNRDRQNALGDQSAALSRLVRTAADGERGFQGASAAILADEEQERQVRQGLLTGQFSPVPRTRPTTLGQAAVAQGQGTVPATARQPSVSFQTPTPAEIGPPPLDRAGQIRLAIFGEDPGSLSDDDIRLRGEIFDAILERDTQRSAELSERKFVEQTRKREASDAALNSRLLAFEVQRGEAEAAAGFGFGGETQANLAQFELEQSRLGLGQTAAGGQPLVPLSLRDAVEQGNLFADPEAVQRIPGGGLGRFIEGALGAGLGEKLEFDPGSEEASEKLITQLGRIPETPKNAEPATTSVFRDLVTASAGAIDAGDTREEVIAAIDLVIADSEARGTPLPAGLKEAVLSSVGLL